DFLKILGISGAGAAAASCSPAPPAIHQKLIPYLVQPEDVTPGENSTYASLLAEAGPEPLGIHAWVRDGRAIFLDGNPDFPLNAGAMSTLGLSALQDLCDPDRVQGPRTKAGDGFGEASWDDALKALGKALGDGSVVLLTGAGTGTRDRFLAEWAEAVGADHVRYESFDYAPLRRAHEIAFGRSEIPAYRVDLADRIVGFGADFLGSWLEPVTFGRRIAHARKIDEGRHAKFTFVGQRVSLTGSNADEWLKARPGTAGIVALAVAREVAAQKGDARARELQGTLSAYTPDWAADRSGVPADAIRALGREIAAAERPVALPPGPESEDHDATDAHLAVALLNYVAGAVGSTVVFGAGPRRGTSATFDDMKALAARMKAGNVRTLIVAGPNPVHTLPASSGFAEALGQVPNVVSLSSHMDETAAAASWILPSSHELESWGDAEVGPGAWALGQPVMRPVFDTRQREDILMGAASTAGIQHDFGAEDFAGYLQSAWREMHRSSDAGQAFDDWWIESKRNGGRWEGTALSGPEPGAAPQGAAAVSLSRQAASYRFPDRKPEAPGDEFDLVVYATGHLYDGRGANRGWMQELPDPVTKVVWGSWVEMHPEAAKPMGLEDGDLVEVESEAGTLRAPVYLYPGIRKDAVAIPMGQGHTHYGRNAAGRGVNPLDLLSARSDAATGSLAYAGVAVGVTATGKKGSLVKLQGSDKDYHREVAEIMELDAARKAIESHEVDLTELVEAAWDSDPMSPYRWGMSVDLNACTGCGACATACYVENNLAVVGEERCAGGREMSWLRVERFFTETEDGGFQTTHLAEMCQHCGDAPCEPVCPVYAAYHNPEGLNVQVYNRCVGTRYCSNNCPYKQRRFNWFTYDFPYPLNLQLNPDVTVREKGVMEKCTFCIQRINRAKVQAKEEGRLVHDGEITTAC
ncbi:MAG TPA: molybdopterin dinucleotide binding domain-containing protein, partial [Gemmatimonadota bacterium]|nr:molybdopterin dinucleotide binding domain-containing protein [Gemmatimonadota bacterium]